MTQISESARYTDSTAAGEGPAEHPAGRVTLRSGGALGQRGRLLSMADGDAGYGPELPVTTFTGPF
ncbi:hypothetical protein [Streptomyces sp. NPDC058330]|uniref:hypothetical protein n=1 Tax=Streptomyces sp. NPDC058330 TaxID=3346449 RepID=UPI0036E0B68F